MNAAYSTAAVCIVVLGLSVTDVAARGGLDETDRALAELHEQRGDRDKALALWRELLARHPDNPLYLERTLTLAHDLDNKRLALALLPRLLALRPRSPDVRKLAADILVGADRSKAALPHLLWLHRLRPKDETVRRNLAQVYDDLDRPAEALPHYLWLVARHPGDAALTYGLVDVYLSIQPSKPRHTTEAAALLKALALRRPHDVEVLRRLVALYVDQSRHGDAISALEDFLRRRPGHPSAQLALDRLKRRRSYVTQKRRVRRTLDDRFEDWRDDLVLRAEDF
ncbi:MAG: tetratricopeptide repeat protein [Deltaproteobacteria bacterium]|nr:tetratricopeptide repeat protein [Deltaproteobacteria bacterium]